jgi:hypothetical protein
MVLYPSTVHLQLAGDFVHYPFDAEDDLGHAGCPEGVDFGPVGRHLVAPGSDVFQVVAGEDRLWRVGKGRTRKGAGLEIGLALGGRELAILGDADLDA